MGKKFNQLISSILTRSDDKTIVTESDDWLDFEGPDPTNSSAGTIHTKFINNQLLYHTINPAFKQKLQDFIVNNLQPFVEKWGYQITEMKQFFSSSHPDKAKRIDDIVNMVKKMWNTCQNGYESK